MDGVPSWAVPGQKVACIKAGDWMASWNTPPHLVPPRFGEVLTIALVREAIQIGWWYLSFVEREPQAIFAIENFAPVAEDNTEAELFRRRQYGADAPRESEVA